MQKNRKYYLDAWFGYKREWFEYLLELPWEGLTEEDIDEMANYHKETLEPFDTFEEALKFKRDLNYFGIETSNVYYK